MKSKYHFSPNGEVLVFPNGDDWGTERILGTYKKFGENWYLCMDKGIGGYDWQWIPNHDNIPKHIRAMAILFP